MPVRRVSRAISCAVSTVVQNVVSGSREQSRASLVEHLEDRKMFATYVVSIDPYLTQGDAGNANTGTLALKDDNRIENPAGATEDDRIKTAIDSAIQSASATTTPPGTTYNYPNTSRFKIGKFSDIAGLTIPSGYTSDDWVIGFEDLTDNDFNDGFWAVKVEVDDGYDDDESESPGDDEVWCPPTGAQPDEADAAETNGPSKNTDNPLSYHDGTVRIVQADFSGVGFGSSWGITRNWSNELTLQGDNAIGSQLSRVPTISEVSTKTTVVVARSSWSAHSGSHYRRPMESCTRRSLFPSGMRRWHSRSSTSLACHFVTSTGTARATLISGVCRCHRSRSCRIARCCTKLLM